MNSSDILYEDNHIIVVLKKPNMLVQKDSTGDIDLVDHVKNYLKEKYKKPGNVYVGLVHRLDRPVGGVMVLAKTSKSAARLSKSIQNHELKKTYLAVIKGDLVSDGTLINYIDRDNKKAIITDEEHGKYAELSYTVIDKYEDLNLVSINLITGRHHQIRIQFAHSGFPLYGDQLYGVEDKEQIALFAYKLEFIHPVTKELMTFKSLPKGKPWYYFELGGNL